MHMGGSAGSYLAKLAVVLSGLLAGAQADHVRGGVERAQAEATDVGLELLGV